MQVLEDVLLVRCSALLVERIVRITGKAAGEIAPIVRIAASRHADFVAVINLRDSTRSEQNCHRHLQLLARGARLAHEADGVMISEKSYQPLGMGIKPVLA